MRSVMNCLLLLLLATTSVGWAQSGGAERVIELKGGDRLVQRADGTMTHYDKTGKSVDMPDGVVMVAKDGSRLMMKGLALWREVLELAASSYAQSITGAAGGSGSRQRTIELKDGGRVLQGADGKMVHYDAAGKRMVMPDGEVMIGKDGSRIMMVNGSLWTPETRREGGKTSP